MLIFIDESGNCRPFQANNNFGERYFTLAAVVIDDKEYKKLKKGWHSIRDKYKTYLGKGEIKSHAIRRSNPNKINIADPPEYDFWKYGKGGKEDYTAFCKDVELLVKLTDFSVISVTVDKLTAQSNYPHIQILPTLLTDLWERIYICHYLRKDKKSRILFDPKLNIDDDTLKSTYRNFIVGGSWFIDPNDLKKVNLYKNVFAPKSEESVGIQLADYCAYPIKRFQETKSYDFFDRVIQSKQHRNVTDKRRGKLVVMGLKLSLSR